MLAYQLRIAAASLRRTPVLSALLVAGIALGVAVATTFVTTFHVMASDPIPDKSRQLFYVQVDNWTPERPWDRDRPEEPPDQLSWRDSQNLLASALPTRQTASFKADLTVHPASRDERPFRALTRVTRPDFFEMFEVPFLYGGPWDEAAEADRAPVVVLDEETNRKLFGGEDSVGETVRIEDRPFTVVGVVAPWSPRPKFFDVTNGALEDPEALYVPLSLTPEMEIRTTGNTSNWKPWDGEEFADFLESESIWLQMWVELPTAEARQEYEDFLAAYVREQQAVGRLTRPVNNRLRDVREWMTVSEVVPPEAKTMLIIGLLFLLVCAINLVGILLGKFLGRAPEVGVRRALGASRGAVFAQHLVECEVVGLLGGAVGIVLSAVVLRVLNRLFSEDLELFALDLTMLGAGVALALVAGLVAGLYPAWRICRVAPATYLKQQ